MADFTVSSPGDVHLSPHIIEEAARRFDAKGSSFRLERDYDDIPSAVFHLREGLFQIFQQCSELTLAGLADVAGVARSRVDSLFSTEIPFKKKDGLAALHALLAVCDGFFKRQIDFSGLSDSAEPESDEQVSFPPVLLKPFFRLSDGRSYSTVKGRSLMAHSENIAEYIQFIRKQFHLTYDQVTDFVKGMDSIRLQALVARRKNFTNLRELNRLRALYGLLLEKQAQLELPVLPHDRRVFSGLVSRVKHHYGMDKDGPIAEHLGFSFTRFRHLTGDDHYRVIHREEAQRIARFRADFDAGTLPFSIEKIAVDTDSLFQWVDFLQEEFPGLTIAHIERLAGIREVLLIDLKMGRCRFTMTMEEIRSLFNLYGYLKRHPEIYIPNWMVLIERHDFEGIAARLKFLVPHADVAQRQWGMGSFGHWRSENGVLKGRPLVVALYKQIGKEAAIQWFKANILEPFFPDWCKTFHPAS